MNVEDRLKYGLPLMEPCKPLHLMVAPAGLVPVECLLPTPAGEALEILAKCVEEVPNAVIQVGEPDFEGYYQLWVRGYRFPTDDELLVLRDQARAERHARKEEALRTLRELRAEDREEEI